MNFPSENTRSLIDALREELQEYGALLHLLKEQQQCLLRQQSERVLTLSEAIETQLTLVLGARLRRQEEVQSLAGKSERFEEPPPIRLNDLLPYFPKSVEPMIRGLVEEINRLIAQVGRLAHQNQMLLVRAVDATRAAIQAAQPGAVNRTYSAAGKTLTHLSSQYLTEPRCLA